MPRTRAASLASPSDSVKHTAPLAPSQHHLSRSRSRAPTCSRHAKRVPSGSAQRSRRSGDRQKTKEAVGALQCGRPEVHSVVPVPQLVLSCCTIHFSRRRRADLVQRSCALTGCLRRDRWPQEMRGRGAAHSAQVARPQARGCHRTVSLPSSSVVAGTTLQSHWPTSAVWIPDKKHSIHACSSTFSR
jgi:hypothetical protein